MRRWGPPTARSVSGATSATTPGTASPPTRSAPAGGVAASDTVPLLSLDGFTRERGIAGAVRFIKIDVEGYEPPVCEGMVDTVAANPGLVAAVEYSPWAMNQMGFRPESVLEFFLTRGFVIQVLHQDGGLEPFDARRPERHLDGRLYVDLLCSREPLPR